MRGYLSDAISKGMNEWEVPTSYNNHDRSIIVLQGAGSDLKGYIESTLIPNLMLPMPDPTPLPLFTIPEIF